MVGLKFVELSLISRFYQPWRFFPYCHGLWKFIRFSVNMVFHNDDFFFLENVIFFQKRHGWNMGHTKKNKWLGKRHGRKNREISHNLTSFSSTMPFVTKFRKNNLLYRNIKFMKFSFIKFLLNHHISECRLMCLKIIPIMTFLWYFPKKKVMLVKNQINWKSHTYLFLRYFSAS